MKKILILLAISMLPLQAAAFDPTFGLFGGDEQPQEPSRKLPALNSMGQNSAMPSAFPESGYGSMPNVPQPPSFTVAPMSSNSPVSFVAPVQPAFSLPNGSPVDVSAAEYSASGLPQLRRPPQFNQQQLGISPAPAARIQSAPIVMPITPVMPSAPIAPILQMQNVAQPPLPKIQPINTDFPKLANVPPAPNAPISAEFDPRVQELKGELAGKFSTPALRVMPRQAPVQMGATTSLAGLKPIGNVPIQKIQPMQTPINSAMNAPIQSVVSEFAQSPAQSYLPPRRAAGFIAPPMSQNITSLGNLRPISSSAKRYKKSNKFLNLDDISGVGTSYKNLDQRRHSAF